MEKTKQEVATITIAKGNGVEENRVRGFALAMIDEAGEVQGNITLLNLTALESTYVYITLRMMCEKMERDDPILAQIYEKAKAEGKTKSGVTVLENTGWEDCKHE